MVHHTSVLAAGTWCVYEQFKANELGIRVVMILPKDQRESITAELRKGVVGFQVIAQSLTNIKVEDSKATVEADGVRPCSSS